MEQRILSTNNNVMMTPTPVPANRTDLTGLKSKLASVSAERNILQETLRQIQNRVAQDVESSLLQQSQNYESRLTELHSVIAELRKQLDAQRANVIPEESCEESCGEDENETQTDDLEVFAPSDVDPDDLSNGTGTGEDDDEDEDEGGEESVRIFRNPCHMTKTTGIPKKATGTSASTEPLKNRNGITRGEVNDKGIQADEFDCPCRVTTSSPSFPIKQPKSQTGDAKDSGAAVISHSESKGTSPVSVSPIATLCKEVAQIREEHVAIRHNLMRKEGELEKTRNALAKIAQERDFLQRKVTDLEYMLREAPRQFPQFISYSPSNSHSSGNSAAGVSNTPPPQAKMAERVRLRAVLPAAAPAPELGSGGSSPQSPMSSLNNNSNPAKENEKQRESPKYRHHSKNQQQLISGAHLVSIGVNCKSRVVEQLTSPLHGESMIQEMESVLTSAQSTAEVREKVREFEVENERLVSRLEHFRAQNDVLSINLAEAKGQANHLATLLGKYESNNLALQMTLGYSDHAIDAYDVLVALLESELGQLLANCRAVGIGSRRNTCPRSSSGSGGSFSSGIGTLGTSQTDEFSPHHSSSSSPNSKDHQAVEEQEDEEDRDIKCLLQRANENRFVAENAARTLLNRVVDTGSTPSSENNNHPSPMQQSSPQTNMATTTSWEEHLAFGHGSQTLSSASSIGERSGSSSVRSHFGFGSCGTNELRIRELIIQLKTDRESVRSTVMDLDSSWSLEPESPTDKAPPTPCDILEAHKLDLEIAVLMQELMAMREERAELRAQLFHLEKDKGSLELLVQKYEVQEEAYKARINYFKGEIESLNQKGSEINDNDNEKRKDTNDNNGTTTRESILRNRVQELATSLEKVTTSSAQREKQCTDMINELKRANGILIETLEGLKRKYQSRVHKMEEQIMAVVERHSIQLKLYKDRVHFLEIEMDGRRN